ncbi:MAG: S9 family peptidase [Bacteroidetes bacterium]|nr:S9 family peptidase [Bacteroidota bacterium]
MKQLIRFIILAAFLPGTFSFGQDKTPIKAGDLMRLVTINQMTTSRDGKFGAGVVNRKAVKNDNEYYYTRHLYLFDLSGKESPKQLTFGDRNDGTPQFSPDGTALAFTRTDNDRSQIWILPLNGGEAYPLTKAEFGASRPRWSPDGKKILYQSSVPRHSIQGNIPWTYERPGRQPGDEPNFKGMKPDEKKKLAGSPDGNLTDVRFWLAKNASEGNPRVLVRQDIQAELGLQPDENFTHLFIQPIEKDAKAELLAGGFQDYQSAEWSPDGKSIVYASKKLDQHPDVEEDNDIWVIEVGTKTASELLHWENNDLNNPMFSPDGSKILFRFRPMLNRHAPPTKLAVVSARGGVPTEITTGFDRDVNNSIWSSDSKTIFFSAESEGYVPVFQVAAGGSKPELLMGAGAGINEFTVANDKIFFVRTTVQEPWEAGVFQLKDKSIRMLTAFNGWVKEKALSEPKAFQITRPDGTPVQYWVMEPIGLKPGSKYPVILNIHGGPSAMWGPAIFSMWHEFQTEAGWGYGIVYCNPRGSGGYGDKFKKGNFQDWGTGPAGDILSSLDEALKNHSWMDANQLFVEGGSYAGYMVSWIIGHDQRFKAANAQRGVYDLTTFMGEGNAWRLIPTHFGGYPWSPGIGEILERNSPINYVDKINTPLLIIHGDQDLRTGVIQSEMLYKSLKILNKPVEYIRYPKEGHELTRSGNPGRMMDHLLRVIEFFERYANHPKP